MEEGTLIVLIACGAFATAFVAAALTRRHPQRVLWAGAVLGFLAWVGMAVVIFRGPDNPDFGELGWTLLAAGVIGLFVGAWMVGAALGGFFRAAVARLRGRPRSDDRQEDVHA